jgi:hypothetical protein
MPARAKFQRERKKIQAGGRHGREPASLEKVLLLCLSLKGNGVMPILFYIAMWSWALGVASCAGAPAGSERES